MHRALLRRLNPAAAAGIVALLLSLGGVALASGSGHGAREIHACVQPAQAGVEGRELSLPIDGRCPNGDKSISWGAKGERGPQGRRGARGAVGRRGPVGPQGATGAAGNVGPTGPEGKGGIQGPEGETGSTGATGAVGAVGPTGPTGAAGARGATGEAGPTGPTGAAGTNGTNGVSGYEVVKTTESATVANGSTVNIYPRFAECAPGKVLIGGGTWSNGGELLHSGPYVSENGTGTVYNMWESMVLYHNESGSTYTLHVTAIAYCASVG